MTGHTAWSAMHWRGKMTDEYDNWRRYEDAKAFKNKLAEIDRLKDRIENLEAALDDVAGYLARADWYYLKPETRKALEGKDD